jgi:hypothetical protein
MPLDVYSSIKKVGWMDRVSKEVIALIACFGTIAAVVSQFLGLPSFTGAGTTLSMSNTLTLGFFVGVLGILMITLRTDLNPRSKTRKGLEFYPQTQNEAQVLSYVNNAAYTNPAHQGKGGASKKKRV